MRRIVRNLILAFVLILASIVAGCSKRGGSGAVSPAPTRAFHMGFPALPYAYSPAALDETWAKVNAHSDMVTIHLESGVPWPEAYANTAYPSAVNTTLDNFAARIESDKAVLLAVVCMDTMRENMCGAWDNTGENQPRTGVWAARTFADPEVAEAYIHWMEHLIDRFNPTYVNYAVEASELALKDPAEFGQFQTFVQRVYPALKARYPALPIFFSLIVKYPGSADASVVNAGFVSLKNYTDVVAVSSYAFAFYYPAASGDPENLPAAWLTQARDLAPDKPFAIAETSWIAEDLKIPAWGVNNPATPANQRAYLERLLAECVAADALFVNWFVIIDYDDLWKNAYGSSDLARLWRDSGLFDENRVARPALALWDQWLARGKP